MADPSTSPEGTGSADTGPTDTGPAGNGTVLGRSERATLQRKIGALAEQFSAAGHRFFVVGGLVRDAVAGRGLTGDIDITTDARPDRIARLVDDWADTVWDQGRRFGTIGARRGDVMVEITTHRAESYDSDSRKPHVRFSDDIETDLGRRDFTVNAMAIEVPGWTLLDPYGGAADLGRGVLRTPAAPEGLFADDPLRMLRAARFSAQLALRPTPELTEAIVACRPRLQIVSRERICTEMARLLGLANPSAGVVMLAETGLLGDLVAPWSDSDATLPTVELDEAALTSVWARVGAQAGSDELIALRWAMLLAPVCDAAAAARCLRQLRCGNDTTVAVKAILAAKSAIDQAVDQAIDWAITEARTAGPAAGEGQLQEAARRLVAGHEPLAQAVCVALSDHRPTAAQRAGLAQLLAALAGISADQVDDLRRLPLDGHEVTELIGESGPIVGQALAWLAEQQIVHGPLDAARARELLAEWASRPS